MIGLSGASTCSNGSPNGAYAKLHWWTKLARAAAR